MFHIVTLLALTTTGAEVETRPATPLGLHGLSANGKVNPRGLPATAWFEYGETTSYGKKSPEMPLPPRLTAYYRETWDHGLAGWLGGMDGKDLTHHATGGKSGGFVRFKEPSGFDPNHVDGIGGLHLSTYFYPATHPSPSGANGQFGGGVADLRDAKISMAVRGNDFVPNGSEMCFWTQSDHDPKFQLSANWRRANWAYTGYRLTDALKSGKWETIAYRLTNDTHAWTYGGNNLAQKRPNYAYDDIDHSLSDVNCDFFHLLAFVDAKKPPTGTLDFDELEIIYRNHNRLYPGNGGKLVSAPKGDDAATLTDGWRNGPGKAWKSAENPSAPLEIEYAFETPITVKAVQVHQNPEWPAKDVEVLLSSDGAKWQTVLKKPLLDKHPAGPNLMFALERGLSVSANRVKVRILAGYKAQHWGLGEVEVFGDGPALPTDDDWCNVNADLKDLKPGQTVHYRLVVKTSAGIVNGSDSTFTIPADTKPHVLTGPATRVSGTGATLEGRLTPMGKSTQFHFEYGPDTKYGQKTASFYGGLQEVPRLVFAAVTGLKPGIYHYRLVAVNETGTSQGEGKTFTAQ